MSSATECSDQAILDLLRKIERISVGQLAKRMGVTATAVRQRLNRLMEQGLIERYAERHGRGRPTHQYGLTSKGVRHTGANFADLAVALWTELQAIPDEPLRQQLLDRVASSMARAYAREVQGDSPGERMQQIRVLLQDRSVPCEVVDADDLPVLNTFACPYPDLAEHDRAICELEEKLYSKLLDQDVRLKECRLDGAACCSFHALETAAGALTTGPVAATR